MNILKLLKNGEKTALIQGNKRVSYTELIEMGARFGGYLHSEGVRKGNIALIFVPLSIELYKAMIGAWSIGAIPVFIDFSRGAKFVNSSISRLKPDIIVCDSGTKFLRGAFSKMRKIKMAEAEKLGEFFEAAELEESYPAIYTFTSGTTGIPKIAVRTHGFLINQYNVLKRHMDFDENHIDLGILPVFTLANLASNMTTLLPERKLNPKKLARQMIKEGVTRMICSPALAGNLLKHGGLRSIKKAYFGGGPVYPSLLYKIRNEADLYIVYGSTEAEPISGIRWADISFIDREKIADGAGLLVGNIAPEIECKIGKNSEILVSGETVLKGYLNGIGDGENKIREGNKIWHRTGDAGYIDKSGRLWLLGRVSNAITDENGTLYPFCAECILDSRFGIRGAVLSLGGKRTAVIEKGAAQSDEILEALKTQGVTEVLTVKKLPMDKRHGAKIEYGRLKRMLKTEKGDWN
ncbi:MAG: AMP-binding protein [Clostridiales bacterium]|nr:AMP-binding protein [Clostridiales bacterium]